MSYDFYAELASLQQCPSDWHVPGGLVSGVVDGCTSWFAAAEVERAAATNDQQRKDADRKKNDARTCYMNRAAQGTLTLPSNLCLDLWSPMLLHDSWLAFEVEFELLTPWYSKDNRPFHVLDNPVRKDRVFGVPFMSAASWKGLLRWACRMQAGLREHLANGKRFEVWNDPDWILHLFGNEKGEAKNFSQGALAFSPTWFDKIGFEVINPHSRARRAGKQPIYYEMVPGRRPKGNSPNEYDEGGKGKLRLLYAPWPGMKQVAKPAQFLPLLLKAIEQLLTRYGISAKRTVGWGTAEISQWRVWKKDKQAAEAGSREDLWKQIESWSESEAKA